MSPERLVDELLEPCARAFAAHTGPFVLEFPPSPAARAAAPGEFLERLDRAARRACRASSSTRSRCGSGRCSRPSTRGVLARHGAGHVYNYWSFMPMPADQARVVPPSDCRSRRAPAAAPGHRATRTSARPSARSTGSSSATIDDAPAGDARSCVARGRNRRRAFVLVNNKAEGSAPLTVRAIARDGRGGSADGEAAGR